MTQVGLQFHATPDECVGLAFEWASRHVLLPVVERFPPYRAELHSAETGPPPSVDGIIRVALCRSTPEIEANGQFVAEQGCFYVHVARLEKEGLREAALGGVSDDPAALKVWRSIVRNARARTHSGALLRSPYAQATDPSHRHSAGAHALAEQGVRMLAVAGWVEYLFPDVAPHPNTLVTFTDPD